MNLPFINLMISSGIKIWCKQDQSPVFGFFKLEFREENLEDTFAELPGWALLLKKTYFKEQNKYVWRSGGKRLIIPMIMYILTLNYVYNVYFKWSEVKTLNHVRLFATPWTVACQAPLFSGILQARILE